MDEHLFHNHNRDLYILESRRFSQKILGGAHLPTLLLLIGYAFFWIELLFLDHPTGHTSWMAWAVFMLVTLIVGLKNLNGLRVFICGTLETTGRLSVLKKLLLGGGLLMVLVMLGISFYASLLPPHMIQEQDALNYHITLPRQLLIQGSFRHLSWSSADLFLLPVNFALAPFWLATSLPNKIPQFIFLLGLLGVCAQLGHRLSGGDRTAVVLVLIGVMAAHNMVIQMGTAMLDLVLCYLFIAALDSFMQKHYAWSAVEFCFYFWSKSFIPIQCVLLLCVIGLVVFLLGKLGFKVRHWAGPARFVSGELKTRRKGFVLFLTVFMISSLLVGGPFVAKSVYYTATPLYPFFPGILRTPTYYGQDTAIWASIVERGERHLATKDQYGSRRDLMAFVQHLWLLAVPEEGVNNRYDYPVGLIYLLCLGPLFYLCGTSIAKKEIDIIPLLIVAFWGIWWLGSHQSRFLFVPIVLLIVCVCADRRFHSGIFFACVVLALGLELISLVRIHRADWGKPAHEVLRPKDQSLLQMSACIDRSQAVELPYCDAAFADFLVSPQNDRSIFVLKQTDSAPESL